MAAEKDAGLDDIVREARAAIQASYDFDKDNRSEAVEDLRFRASFQWSDTAKAERAGRPMITINRTDQFIHQVVNPIRQNMPTIKVEPDGDDQSDMAEIADGIIRRIQYNSSASHVYASAVEHMATCGIGWFRATTDYANKDSFDQEIVIKRVFDPLSVYPDPAAREPDRSDMEWCLVSEMWPLEAFKKRWPGKSLKPIDTPSDGKSMATGFSWSSSDEIRVAEYWRRKKVSKKLVQLQNGQVADFALVSKVDPRLAEQMKPLIVNEREVDDYKVEMVLVSGAEQLEETYECPCYWIPVIPVIGAEIPLQTGVYRYGLLRMQREPQQLHNYFMSVAAEALGQQPKSPLLAPFEAIKKYKNVWDTHNLRPVPYLPYDPIPGAPNGGRPERIEPPPLPAGLIAMAQMLQDDMKAATGQYDASLGNRSNETSGVAIGQRQQQSDNATYHFTDNLEHSLEHLGRVLLDMIPKVYDTQRTMRIRAGDDTEKTVTINQPTVGDYVHNDVAGMSFSNVRVVLGPSFASKRREAQETLLGLMQAVPGIAQVGGDIIVRQFDFDGAEELAERLKKAVPANLLSEEEQQAAQANQPDPMQDPAVQAQLAELTAKVEKMQQEARKTAADAEAQEFENAMAMGQAANGMHPTQQHPLQEKQFDAEVDAQRSERDAQRSDQHRYEDRQWSVEDQRRQASQRVSAP